MVQAPQQSTRYPQYGGGGTVRFEKPKDLGRKRLAIAALAIGILGVAWGLFAAPTGKVSPELELLGPDESRLVTVICSPCDPAAAKAIVGEENYLGAPAPDRFVVRATGTQILEMETMDWVKYIAR